MGEVVILRPPQLTPMKSRRTIKFNHNPINYHPSPKTVPDIRRQTPPKSILRNRINTPEAASNKNNMVMGQVKILKRGELLQETTSKNLKHLNRPTISNGPENSEVRISDKKPVKNKEKKIVVNAYSRRKVEVKKSDQDDVNISSTRPGRLKPDPVVVSSECFAGSVFSDSPSPSSVPLPGFFIKNNSDATVNLHRILGLTL